jgi:hypothetical protein
MLELLVLAIIACAIVAFPLKLILDHFGPLKPCRYCRSDVAKIAQWCPRCGGPNP